MNLETIATVPNCPSELGWLPDGRLLVVSMTDRRMLRQEPDGTLVTHAELSRVAAYRSSIAAEDLEFPNGSVITPDGETLIREQKHGPAAHSLHRGRGRLAVATAGMGRPRQGNNPMTSASMP